MRAAIVLLAIISHATANLLMPGIYTEVVEIQAGKVSSCVPFQITTNFLHTHFSTNWSECPKQLSTEPSCNWSSHATRTLNSNSTWVCFKNNFILHVITLCNCWVRNDVREVSLPHCFNHFAIHIGHSLSMKCSYFRLSLCFALLHATKNFSILRKTRDVKTW